ncbi:GTPase Era [Candidatus Roizmanbacteria bacterium RIFCSPLOWO2_01_FULL_37_12]|uniref:GTPase Era n=1 Tax=Candidatus Roizmanbacteria bacterium RIFCSPLOWO2_01_FULL_37_12 TaxID=1802056 RepID=A0A1F7I9R8_9BACT|nr:MAG: GTPase Era [Candidatus Roizmanbacteria bacterium RIFCSPHIGHO2_02_FULL_37_9b]OGK40114.1 MAG: GTPase Era [Candidatus Roizmanbacteria bacterium RIFCSPLOWO2_01_FULL_37_12]
MKTHNANSAFVATLAKEVASRVKSGKVLLIGRPNVGKSTFLNNLIGQKVAITSPKPQTTRFPIKALYEDERGKIIFVDTPGIFSPRGKPATGWSLSQILNQSSLREINDEVDLVIYMIDHTRRRDFEEAKVIGIVRKINKPKILVINKVDLQEKTYLPQYKFLEDEIPLVFQISALKNLHIKPLINKIFELLPEEPTSHPQGVQAQQALPEGENENRVYPLLNMDSKTFISELIREKVFLMMGEEIPYTTTAIVDEIKEKGGKIIYIKARILTTNDRHKGMLIGAEGRKIKEIGSYARKEIALATGKIIYLDLTVETDPHWQEVYYS